MRLLSEDGDSIAAIPDIAELWFSPCYLLIPGLTNLLWQSQLHIPGILFILTTALSNCLKMSTDLHRNRICGKFCSSGLPQRQHSAFVSFSDCYISLPGPSLPSALFGVSVGRSARKERQEGVLPEGAGLVHSCAFPLQLCKTPGNWSSSWVPSSSWYQWKSHMMTSDFPMRGGEVGRAPENIQGQPCPPFSWSAPSVPGTPLLAVGNIHRACCPQICRM